MAVEHPVLATIQAQVDAWNAGDLEGFVRHVHADVVYVTPNGILRGAEALHDAYRGDWRDSPGGELTAQVEDVIDHGGVVTVIARYWLSGSRDDRAGWSLLTFVDTPSGWKLTADATMRSPRGSA
ncbi:MAG: ketosteroid isomerase-like protein [Myxococcota bacterium]|jgi:ketosteroid isomerase-like protein